MEKHACLRPYWLLSTVFFSARDHQRGGYFGARALVLFCRPAPYEWDELDKLRRHIFIASLHLCILLFVVYLFHVRPVSLGRKRNKSPHRKCDTVKLTRFHCQSVITVLTSTDFERDSRLSPLFVFSCFVAHVPVLPHRLDERKLRPQRYRARPVASPRALPRSLGGDLAAGHEIGPVRCKDRE